MQRERFLYLAGLLPVAILAILLSIWLSFAPTPIGWLGLVLSPLGLIIASIGWVKAWQFYNDKTASSNELQQRRKHFLGHIFVLSLGLGFSWLSFQTFKAQVSFSKGAKSQLEVQLKNTSSETVKDLKIQLGQQKQTVPVLTSRESKSLYFNILSQKTLQVELNRPEGQRVSQVAVGPENHHVLVRIDPQLNLLPEVQ